MLRQFKILISFLFGKSCEVKNVSTFEKYAESIKYGFLFHEKLPLAL